MQDQPIDRLNPAFDIEIPFTISDTSGRLSMPTLRFDSREASMTMSMDSPPAWMAVDPDLHILAEWTVNAPDDWHRTLAQAGPTLGARVQGVRGLRATESTEHVQTLVTLARDPNAPSFLREQAARAAVELSSAEAVPDLLAGAADDPAVRRVTLDEFNSWVVDGPDEDDANSDPTVKDVDESIVVAIAATARTDRSARTRQQALIALGRLNAPDALNVLMSATATDSQNDRVRQGALEGLGLLDDPQALDTVLRHARPGTINRTRPVAISAAVNLASHDQDAVFNALRNIVETDRERRSKNAAAQALVSLEDARGVAALQSASKSARDLLTSQRMADLATELQEIVGN
ncbi:MAG: HEAT repeat domain-containing protein [Planctomycetota bacterium]